jgi:hypothetical protein
MKRLAPLVALLWWGQIPLCLLAAEASHAHGSAQAVATGEHQHTGHGAAPATAPEDEGGPADPSCAEHCASLAQAVPVPATSSAAPLAASLVLPFAAAAIAPVPPCLWRPSGALSPPPPEPPHRTSVLRL